MALNKVTYTDDVTVVEAQNLNDIQDEIITNASLFSSLTKYKGTMGEDPNTSLDFNDYKTSGIYYNGGTNNPVFSNPPHNADNGWLVVNTFSTVRAQQIWYGAYTGVIKKRHYNAGTGAWTLWYEVVTTSGCTFNGNVAINNSNGVANQDNLVALSLGNGVAKTSAGHSEGYIALYGNTGKYTSVNAFNSTANRTISLPDASGTIALQEKILKQEASVEVVGNPTGWVYKNITFPTPFIKQPLVSVSLYGTSYATDWTMPMLANVTQTGFQMGWWHASGTRNVYWQAFGVVN